MEQVIRSIAYVCAACGCSFFYSILIKKTLATVPSRRYRRRRAYEYRQELMYLSMVNLHIESRFRYGKSKWPSFSSSQFGLVGRLGLGPGLKPV